MEQIRSQMTVFYTDLKTCLEGILEAAFCRNLHLVQFGASQSF